MSAAQAMAAGPNTTMERLDAFMARANAAYYASHDPFADFTTAPEISQVFGEILGAWAAEMWQAIGAPDPVLLIEAGPGRGTLMQDVLRLISRVAPAFRSALRVHFIETSARLRAEQAQRVPQATWHDDMAAVPAGPCIVLANEFLDALPIRQFVRTAEGGAERFVADGRFVECPCEGFLPDAPPGSIPGSIWERSEAAIAWVEAVAARVMQHGGAALILDYGTSESRPGDSFQALKGGRPADPLAEPGMADLTAHVDFAALAKAARAAGAAVWGSVPQGVFLGRLGLAQRTEFLARANPLSASDLRESARRLAEPSRMGLLFKAMCVTRPSAPRPPGFAA